MDDKSLDFNSIVAWLEELTLLGQAMRKTITQLMLCQETYLEMTKCMYWDSIELIHGFSAFFLLYPRVYCDFCNCFLAN